MDLLAVGSRGASESIGLLPFGDGARCRETSRRRGRSTLARRVRRSARSPPDARLAPRGNWFARGMAPRSPAMDVRPVGVATSGPRFGFRHTLLSLSWRWSRDCLVVMTRRRPTTRRQPMRALVAASFLSMTAFCIGCADGGDPMVAKQSGGIAVVRGTVKGYTAAEGAGAAMAAHDAVVAQIKPSILAAGDRAHTVFLGVADPSAFLAVDRWDDLEAARATYGSPSFQAGFAAVLDGAPSIDYYLVAPGFDSYGTLDVAVNGMPSFGFVVEGTLKEADTAKSAAAQNMILDA